MATLLDSNFRWQSYINSLKTNFTKIARLDFIQPDGSVAFCVGTSPEVIDARNNSVPSGAFIQDGTLTVNLQNGQRRSATITLANLDGAFDYNINTIWFGQQIALYEGMLLPDGEELYFAQGVFYIKDPEEIRMPDKTIATFNLVDKWSYLDGTLFGNLDGIYEVPVGANIFQAIDSILHFDRGNGTQLDSTPALYTDYYNGKKVTLQDGSNVYMTTTPYTVRADSDSSTYADVILELNSMLAGWIGYDQNGQLRLDPSQDDIEDGSKAIVWDFTPEEGQFLGATYTVKNSEVYNDIIVQGEAMDDYTQPSGRATNTDPSSDTNIYGSIGRRTKRYSQTGFCSNEVCQDLAVWYLKRNTVLQKSVTIMSTQMFHIAENNIVTIKRTDKPGEPVERHLVTGFTRPIAQTGQMTINATSVQDFPEVEATSDPLPNAYSAFETLSWAKIAEACQKGIASTVWKVGQSKMIEWDYETQLEVIILGFNHDSLATSDAMYNSDGNSDYNNGSNKAAITMGLRNCIPTMYRQRSSAVNNNGWGNSGSAWLRKIVEGVIKDQLFADPELAANVRTINKKYFYPDGTEHNYNCSITIPCVREITGSGPNDGTRYKYYTDGNNKEKSVEGAINPYWTRSVDTGTGFYTINTSGAAAATASNTYQGVTVLFCL